MSTEQFLCVSLAQTREDTAIHSLSLSSDTNPTKELVQCFCVDGGNRNHYPWSPHNHPRESSYCSSGFMGWNWKNVRAWQFLASALDLLGYRPLFWLSLPLPSFEPQHTRVTELPQELDHLDLYCAVVCM